MGKSKSIFEEFYEDWIKAGFSLEEIIVWKASVVYPHEALEWKEKGFSPHEVLEWRRYGFETVSKAEEWKKAGFKPKEAEEWRYYGFDLEKALEWKELGLTAREAGDWKKLMDDYRVSERAIIDYIKKGYTPFEARDEIRKRMLKKEERIEYFMKRIILPKKYMKSLLERYNFKNAELEGNLYVIKKESYLCLDYKNNCRKCPFYRVYGGCDKFIEEMIGEKPVFWELFDRVYWCKDENKQARRQLSELRKKMKKYIKFC